MRFFVKGQLEKYGLGWGLYFLLFLLAIPASADAPFAFETMITTSANGANAVYAADVDRDGDVDVISASSGDDTIAWYENTAGDGSGWTKIVVSTLADSAKSVFAGDIDKDGDIDIVSASANDNKIAWYENTAGDGSVWTEHVVSTTANDANSVIAADMDGDGDLDLASSLYGGNRVLWHENTAGDGSSWSEHTVATGVYSRSVYAGDIDDDGDFDLICPLSNKIAWYQNTNGDGTAWTETTIDSPGQLTSIYPVDVDGDGDLDVMAALNQNSDIAWYENTDGKGQNWVKQTVPSTVISPVVAFAQDIDGDGDADLMSSSIVSSDEIFWYENPDDTGAAWREHVIKTTSGRISSIYAADMDSDGDLDLVYASSEDDKVSWQKNESIHRSTVFPGVSVISNSIDFPNLIYTADLDGDGDQDLLSSSNSDDQINWHENYDGDGSTWFTHLIFGFADGARAVYSADIDRDGDLDVISTSLSDSMIRWYENGQSGTNWAEHTVGEYHDGADFLLVDDIDGDGDFDIGSPSRNPDGSTIVWYENTQGDGSTWSKHEFQTGTEAYIYSFYAEDIDGDGDLDLMCGFSDARVIWYQNVNGDGSLWSEKVISSTAQGVIGIFAADIDNDGDIDVLAAPQYPDRVAWYENMLGDGTNWTEHAISSSVVGITSLFAADMDKDGDVDVASTSHSDDKISWHENIQGNGLNWIDHIISTSANGAGQVLATDVDTDGDLDLISSFSDTDKLVWFKNSGGQFALATNETAPARLYDGEIYSIFKIIASHSGRQGESDIELSTLELLFEEDTGDPLISSEANALIENLFIYLDDGSGVFEIGNDILVATEDTLALTNGTQTIEFIDGGDNVHITLGTPKTYFVVVEFATEAASQSPNQLQITHVTESSSTAEDRNHDTRLLMEDVDNVTSALMTVLLFDSDQDDMFDGWEMDYFGDLSHNGAADSDSDGLTDLQEYQNGTNPIDTDSDDDHMLDGWEVDNGLNPLLDDSLDDADQDKFTNGREHQDKTDPQNNASHLDFPTHSGRIPDTGQTKCYSNTQEITCPQKTEAFYGQDANYTINPPRYVKNGCPGELSG